MILVQNSTIMEEEIEDLVGDVRCTDSQKSVTTSNAYSPDFTDSSSDKNHSSSKDTYVIDYDSDESDKTFQIRHNPSIVNLKMHVEDLPENQNSREPVHTINRSACTSFHKYAVISQEICTQTSKTIFELVAGETDVYDAIDRKTLQTQTSFMSITENKTIEYKLESRNVNESTVKHEPVTNECSEESQQESSCNMVDYKQTINTSQEESSTKYPESETHNETVDTEDADSESTFSDRIIQFIDAVSYENLLNKNQEKFENCDQESSKFDSDFEEDSLIVQDFHSDKNNQQNSISDTSVPKSVDNDVEELYSKISESIDVFTCEKPLESSLRRFGTLTPLTEETVPKKDSIIDVTPCINTIEEPVEKDVKPCNYNASMKLSQSAESAVDKDKFKLPPIKKNKSCPNSPNLNFLFSINASSQSCDFCTKSLAGGESPLISGRSDPTQKSRTTDAFRLPPIHVEGIVKNANNKVHYFSTSRLDACSRDSSYQESININDKIKELKVVDRRVRANHSPSRAISPTKRAEIRSRGSSPTSTSSPDASRLCDAAERGSEALCVELLRRLRSPSWTETADTLEELPRIMEKFWSVLNENRIADLIRQVTIHIDSPRTQVARLACNTIAEILKNTNFTRKPDFYEAVTTLLTKTGSLSRPVRRAANVALDDIVSSAELSHAVTALCIHGVGHKSALVRCAAARLLVVCCALGEGGRLLLRGRPPSAATARRHALRSLAVLLDDKNIEARKYAERLYLMLRPLANFEAYFLTDVDVELAAQQMKRFDQILLRTPKTR